MLIGEIMSKNLKISYILSMIFAGIIMAWGTISNYFSGVGVCFILLVGILTTLLIFLLTDSFVKSRIKDLFIVTCVFVLLEFFVYFLMEFNLLSIDAMLGMLRYQMFISILALIYLVYVIFRFILDLKDIKVGFIETMLGNKERTKKIKTAKELSNGSLEEKPNQKNNEHASQTEESKVSNETVDIEIDEE